MDLICSKKLRRVEEAHNQSCGKGEIEVQTFPGCDLGTTTTVQFYYCSVSENWLTSSFWCVRRSWRETKEDLTKVLLWFVCHRWNCALPTSSRWSVTLPFLRTNNHDCEAEAHACPEHDAFQALEDPHSFAYFWYFLKKCVMLLDFVGTCRHYILQPVFICAWSNHRKLTTSTLLMMCDLSLVLSLPERRMHFPSWLYSSGHPGYCHFFSLRRPALHQPYILPETKLLFVSSNIEAYIYHRHWHFSPSIKYCDHFITQHYSHHVGQACWTSKNKHSSSNCQYAGPTLQHSSGCLYVFIRCPWQHIKIHAEVRKWHPSSDCMKCWLFYGGGLL